MYLKNGNPKTELFQRIPKLLMGMMLITAPFISCVKSNLPPAIHNVEEESSSTRIFRLSPGDTIEVKFRFWPELDDTQTIRPDGNISLQLVDEVKVAGKTPMELDEYLTNLYEEKLKEPVITVIVRDIADQVIYVGGEVRNPGMLILKRKSTVLEAIMEAGGFNSKSARTENILVIRHSDGVRHITVVNVEKILKEPQSEPFYLTSKDIIYVPRTRIDQINQWIDQYLTKMIPNTPFNFQYRVNDRTTIGYSP